MHYTSGNVPACSGTGHVRRFIVTSKPSEVTCTKCKKILDRRMAQIAAEIRNDVLGVA